MSEFKKIYGKKYPDPKYKKVCNIWVRYKSNPKEWILKEEISLGSAFKPNDEIYEILITDLNEKPINFK